MSFRVVVDGRPHRVEVLHHDLDRCHVRVDGEHEITVERERVVRSSAHQPTSTPAIAPPPSVSTNKPGVITAPISGKVLALPVAVGERVERGTCVAVIEAMKMENKISAPSAGRVKELAVTVGADVRAGTGLVVLE